MAGRVDRLQRLRAKVQGLLIDDQLVRIDTQPCRVVDADSDWHTQPRLKVGHLLVVVAVPVGDQDAPHRQSIRGPGDGVRLVAAVDDIGLAGSTSETM